MPNYIDELLEEWIKNNTLFKCGKCGLESDYEETHRLHIKTHLTFEL